ncbi:transposase [Hymenobacter profundi]|uniref:Transposase n=1 Tax=Hymenobacter profundi TaxID=1982110 RepID=A0ABS6X1C7_9BACT|nr:transposase [Hymenobacter profundi]MBW3129637.1 transposase [Hymenobacter profundi]
MRYEAEQLYHVYNRGNNQQQIFFTPGHYVYFLRKIRQYVRPHCEILCYCSMPNHFHLLIYTTAAGCRDQDTSSSTKQPIVQGLALALSTYTQGFNKETGRTGALFQSKTKARRLLDLYEQYLRTCFHYIHQNPVRAGLAQRLEGWVYSSYPEYAGLRNGSMCNQQVARELLDIPVEYDVFRREAEQMIDPDRVAGWL